MSQPPDPNWFDFGGAAGAPPPSPSGGDQAGGYGAPGGYGGPPGGGSGYGGPPGGGSPYGGPGHPLVPGPAPILASFAPPGTQSRLTIFFRGILAIPHVIVLGALGIATEVVVVIGWFAALFMGELPDWAHTFVTGFLRWQLRVSGYLYLLTGTYPPFSLEDGPYPVRLVTARTRLNRLAVLFRVILAIPAWLVAGAAGFGLAILSLAGWLIGLVIGRLPDSVHLALAAFIRYQVRFTGWYCMLTGEYPKGLLGDGEALSAPAGAPLDAPGSPSAEFFGAGAATAVLAPADQPPAVAGPWRLDLTASARRLVIVFLAIGALALVGYIVGMSLLVSSRITVGYTNGTAVVSTEVAYTTLTDTVSKFPAKVQACQGDLTCVTAADRSVAAAIKTFGTAVQNAGFTGPAVTDANAVVNDANAAAQSLDQLGSATSVAQYQQIASASQLQLQLTTLDTDVTKLLSD